MSSLLSRSFSPTESPIPKISIVERLIRIRIRNRWYARDFVCRQSIVLPSEKLAVRFQECAAALSISCKVNRKSESATPSRASRTSFSIHRLPRGFATSRQRSSQSFLFPRVKWSVSSRQSEKPVW